MTRPLMNKQWLLKHAPWRVVESRVHTLFEYRWIVMGRTGSALASCRSKEEAQELVDLWTTDLAMHFMVEGTAAEKL